MNKTLPSTTGDAAVLPRGGGERGVRKGRRRCLGTGRIRPRTAPPHVRQCRDPRATQGELQIASFAAGGGGGAAATVLTDLIGGVCYEYCFHCCMSTRGVNSSSTINTVLYGSTSV